MNCEVPIGSPCVRVADATAVAGVAAVDEGADEGADEAEEEGADEDDEAPWFNEARAAAPLAR